MTRFTYLLLLAWAALFFAVPPARAETTTERAKVTPALVATVSRALSRPMDARQCQVVSDTLATTAEPRNLLAIMVLESGMDREAQAWYVLGGRVVVDVGLMQVRCILRHGRCTNWPVRGLTVVQLQDVGTNISAAERLLAKKRRLGGARALDWYAGDKDGSSGYSANVAALVAAFGGVEVQVKSSRVRELVRKIAEAVRREKRS
jgi:hypothetical protein